MRLFHVELHMDPSCIREEHKEYGHSILVSLYLILGSCSAMAVCNWAGEYFKKFNNGGHRREPKTGSYLFGLSNHDV
jgi:hypothetical protein